MDIYNILKTMNLNIKFLNEEMNKKTRYINFLHDKINELDYNYNKSKLSNKIKKWKWAHELIKYIDK